MKKEMNAMKKKKRNVWVVVVEGVILVVLMLSALFGLKLYVIREVGCAFRYTVENFTEGFYAFNNEEISVNVIDKDEKASSDVKGRWKYD